MFYFNLLHLLCSLSETRRGWKFWLTLRKRRQSKFQPRRISLRLTYCDAQNLNLVWRISQFSRCCFLRLGKHRHRLAGIVPIRRKTQETINQFTTGYGHILLYSRSKENVYHVNCNDHKMFIYFLIYREVVAGMRCVMYTVVFEQTS